MKEYFALFCGGVGFVKLVLAAFGYHGLDGVLDQAANVCSSIAVPVAANVLAKSSKYVD